MSKVIGSVEVCGYKMPVYDIPIHPSVLAARELHRTKKQKRKDEAREKADNPPTADEIKMKDYHKKIASITKESRVLKAENRKLKREKKFFYITIAALSVAVITLLAQ